MESELIHPELIDLPVGWPRGTRWEGGGGDEPSSEGSTLTSQTPTPSDFSTDIFLIPTPVGGSAISRTPLGHGLVVFLRGCLPLDVPDVLTSC